MKMIYPNPFLKYKYLVVDQYKLQANTFIWGVFYILPLRSKKTIGVWHIKWKKQTK